MPRALGSRQFRDRIIGRTISGVIARPGRDGEPPMVLMLRFEDGGVVEFVSPGSDRLLGEAIVASAASMSHWADPAALEAGAQLSLDGLFAASRPDAAPLRLAS